MVSSAEGVPVLAAVGAFGARRNDVASEAVTVREASGPSTLRPHGH